MSRIMLVTLPDCFYLPRYSALGLEIRDVMPLASAIAYITDGVRIGIQFRDGAVAWLLEPEGAMPVAESFLLRRDLLPGTLTIDMAPGQIMHSVWRNNLDVFAVRTSGEAA